MSEPFNSPDALPVVVKRRPVLSAVLALLALALGYLLFWPVPFDPVASPVPPPSPAGAGVYAPNTRLAEAAHLKSGVGPEGVEMDAAGNLYTGLHDGRILRFGTDGSVRELANTGGRPLGLEFDARGNLIIADAIAGLLSLAPDGTLEVLALELDGKRMIFVDDLAIASDGKIYFSDASTRHTYGGDIADLLENRATGRLIVYDPATEKLEVLLDGLYFANGVALSPDESFVLVNETFRYRIARYWLTGDKAGTHDIFTENLPGYPDNLTEAPDGGYWLALVAPRLPELDALMPYPFLRKVFWRALEIAGQSPAQPQSWAVKLDRNGKAVDALEDTTGHIFMMTSVLERGGKLYLGSLVNDVIGIIDAP